MAGWGREGGEGSRFTAGGSIVVCAERVAFGVTLYRQAFFVRVLGILLYFILFYFYFGLSSYHNDVSCPPFPTCVAGPVAAAVQVRELPSYDPT